MKVKISKALLSVIGLMATKTMVLAQQATDIVEPPKPFGVGWNWNAIMYILLVLAIIFVCARVFDLAKLTEKSTEKRVIDWNKTNATIAVVVFLILGALCAYEFAYHSKYIKLGNSGAEHGESIDSMFRWTFGFTFVVFVITEFLLFYFMWRYQYRDGKKAWYYFHNNKLELLWTVVPAIVLTFLVLRGFNTWSTITNPDEEKSEKIEVFAYQFGWKARYPGTDNKIGNSNFNFISANNPLGVASKAHAEELLKTLKEDIATAKDKLANISAQIGVWAKEYENVKQMERAYPDRYKQALDKYMDGKNGVYKRELEREIKRKETAIMRIQKYMSDKEFMDETGNDDLVTTEIVMVKNKPYIFKFRARDVIHSAYIPEFRVQMNCVPGMGTQFGFKPIKTTAEARTEKGDPEFDYYLFCNKICGAAHYNMKIKITVVDNETELKTWLASQTPVVAPKVEATPLTPTADSTGAVAMVNVKQIK